MRAAIYTRISQVDAEGEETSTLRQEQDCRTLCQLRGWDVIDVFTDVGLSGWNKKVHRPGLEALLSAVRADKIDFVVIYKLDRLTRRVLHLLDIVRILEEANCGFASVNDPGIDTSGAMGRFVLTIMGAVAELESDTIRLRVKRANRQLVDEGKAHQGGLRPFGWNDDRVSLNSEEAEIVREIVQRFVAGEGLYSLVVEMRERGINGSRGTPLNFNSVATLLRNPRLAGFRNHLGKVVPSEIEPILTIEEFNDLQKRLGGPTLIVGDLRLSLRREPHWTTKEARLLSGLVYCTCCRQPMRYGHSKGKGRYVCVSQKLAIQADWLERHVSSDALLALAGRATKTDDVRTAEAILSDLKAVREQMERLTVAHYVDGLPENEYRAARFPLTERLGNLEAELIAARDMRLGPEGARYGYSDWWKTASTIDKRNALKSLIDKIWIDGDKKTRDRLKAESSRPVSQELVRESRVFIEYV